MWNCQKTILWKILWWPLSTWVNIFHIISQGLEIETAWYKCLLLGWVYKIHALTVCCISLTICGSRVRRSLSSPYTLMPTPNHIEMEIQLGYWAADLGLTSHPFLNLSLRQNWRLGPNSTHPMTNQIPQNRMFKTWKPFTEKPSQNMLKWSACFNMYSIYKQ